MVKKYRALMLEPLLWVLGKKCITNYLPGCGKTRFLSDFVPLPYDVIAYFFETTRSNMYIFV